MLMASVANGLWERTPGTRWCRWPFHFALRASFSKEAMQAAIPRSDAFEDSAVEEICNDNSQEGARDEVEGSFRPTGRHCYPGEISEGCTLRNFVEWRNLEACRPFFTNSWFNRDFRQFSRHSSFFSPFLLKKWLEHLFHALGSTPAWIAVSFSLTLSKFLYSVPSFFLIGVQQTSRLDDCNALLSACPDTLIQLV